MCDIDTDGDHAAVWEEYLVTRARKDHVCGMCGGVIARGSSYMKHFSVFDGLVGATSEKKCLPCETITCAFRREHRTWFSPSGMGELIKECLDQESYPWEIDESDEAYHDDDSATRLPSKLDDNALRWKYALEEMERRMSERRRKVAVDADRQEAPATRHDHQGGG